MTDKSQKFEKKPLPYIRWFMFWLYRRNYCRFSPNRRLKSGFHCFLIADIAAT